jgi:hypothetical protein
VFLVVVVLVHIDVRLDVRFDLLVRHGVMPARW